MKRFTALLVTLFLCMPLANAAKDNNANEFGSFRIVLMVDPLRSTFAGGTEKVSKQKIQQAIAIGALAKDWKVLKELSGRTELTTTVNGKHVAHVMVVYDDTGFEIQYLDSTNLLYTEKQEGSRMVRGINKNYNVWIRELATAISNKAGEPARVTATPAQSGAASTAPRTPALGHAHAVPSDSGFAAITDVNAVPLRMAGKDRYQHYLTLPSPKAFVVTEKGDWKIFSKSADVMALGLDYCEQQTIGCWLYAVDDKVVWNANPKLRYSRFEQLLKGVH